MTFSMEFKECPNCKSTETVCRLACADEPSIPKGTFVSLEKFFCPFQEPGRAVGLTVKGILVHFDVCAKCGTRYSTKAEIASVPVTVQQFPSKNPPFPRTR